MGARRGGGRLLSLQSYRPMLLPLAYGVKAMAKGGWAMSARRRPVAGEESGPAIALARLSAGVGAQRLRCPIYPRLRVCLMAQPAGANAKYTG